MRLGDGKVGSYSRRKPAQTTIEALGHTCGHDVNEVSFLAYKFMMISIGLLKGLIGRYFSQIILDNQRVYVRAGLERHTIRC